VKPLPQVDIPFTGLYDTLVQPIFARMLLTAIELGVLDHTNAPVSADAIARAIATHPGNTALLLNGLTAMGLLEKNDGLYSNVPVSETFLSHDSPTYLGKLLADSSSEWFAPLVENMTALVKDGPSPRLRPAAAPGDTAERHAILSLHYERAGIARQVAELISELPEFPAFRKMLDLGGGPGLIGLAVVATHPSLKGTVFDLPAVTAVTEAVIDEYDARDRLDTVSGDYLEDDIGEGYDLVLACSTLSAARASLDSVMAKVRDSLNPGGVLVSLHPGLTHERTRPPVMVATMLSAAMFGPDPTFDQGEIAGAMRRAGFRSVDSQTVPTDIGPIDLDIARR